MHQYFVKFNNLQIITIRFIKKRIIEIQLLILHNNWHHIGTKDNPANLKKKRVKKCTTKFFVTYYLLILFERFDV